MIPDGDRYFIGKQDSSTPFGLLPSGVISRLYNGRFVKGAISNAVGFDEIEVRYFQGTEKKVFGSRVTYQDILTKGDVQNVAPLQNIGGRFLVAVISGILFLINTADGLAYDITPTDANLPTSSEYNNLSHLDNNGGVFGLNGWQIIFNYPNLPIFINHQGARLSKPAEGEMPIARLGATVGNRCAIIVGDNVLLMSDPLGGASGLGPLTFHQILDPSTGFTGQKHTIGSSLEAEYITALARLPKFLGPNLDFLALNLLASSRKHKYIVAAGAARDSWNNMQFITYAGSTEGFSGPLATTSIGDNTAYISTSGRIKLLSQDQQRETALAESFFDDNLGQLLNKNESQYYFREWYKTLNHSRSMLKFSNNRLYASVYPVKYPAIGKYGQAQETLTHKALAVASLDSKSLIGPTVSMEWEGFYDTISPVGMVTMDEDLYVVSKNKYGNVKYLKSNKVRRSASPTTICTKGYFEKVPGTSKSLLSGSIFFRQICSEISVTISYLSNNRWKSLKPYITDKKLLKFTIREDRERSLSSSIPLQIEIDHRGSPVEVEAILVNGETFADEQNR